MIKELLLLAEKVAERNEEAKAFRKLTSYLDHSGLDIHTNYLYWSIHVNEYPIHLFFNIEIIKQECEEVGTMPREDFCLDDSSIYFLQCYLNGSISSDLVEILKDDFDWLRVGVPVEINEKTVDDIIENFERFKKRILEL
jgi:hypothetical protein